METLFTWIAVTVTNPYFGVAGAVLILLGSFQLKKLKDFPLEKIKVTATTAGMLGTFLGIAGGLYLFDASQIDSSVPKLLGGLKTAFYTSIAGIFTSLLAQFKPELYVSSEHMEDTKDDSQVLAEMLAEMKSMNSSLVGDGDATLSTILIKMKDSIVEEQKTLNKSFKEFSEQMVNSNIDALAEAIDKVMGDFNTTVNEKLGEAFDNFRKSVENLNEWQSEYKDEIISQTENLKAVKDSLTTASDSIVSIKNSSEDILDIKKKFDELLVNLNANLSGSVEFSTALKELSENLDGAGNMIKEEMENITHGAATEMEKTMNKTLADFGSNLASISGKMADDFGRIQQMLEERNS